MVENQLSDVPDWVDFTLLASAMKGNALLVECSSEETFLRRIESSCLKGAISGVRKKSRVIASILVKRSVNRTIVQRKQDRKIWSREILHETFWKQRYTLTYPYALRFGTATGLLLLKPSRWSSKERAFSRFGVVSIYLWFWKQNPSTFNVKGMCDEGRHLGAGGFINFFRVLQILIFHNIWRANAADTKETADE